MKKRYEHPLTKAERNIKSAKEALLMNMIFIFRTLTPTGESVTSKRTQHGITNPFEEIEKVEKEIKPTEHGLTAIHLYRHNGLRILSIRKLHSKLYSVTTPNHEERIQLNKGQLKKLLAEVTEIVNTWREEEQKQKRTLTYGLSLN